MPLPIDIPVCVVICVETRAGENAEVHNRRNLEKPVPIRSEKELPEMRVRYTAPRQHVYISTGFMRKSDHQRALHDAAGIGDGFGASRSAKYSMSIE
jgi:hypothetical protein